MSAFHGWDRIRNDKRSWTDFEASNRSKIRIQDDGTIVMRGDFDRLNSTEQEGLKFVFQEVVNIAFGTPSVEIPVEPPVESPPDSTPSDETT
jgi:hypothetical protein